MRSLCLCSTENVQVRRVLLVTLACMALFLGNFICFAPFGPVLTVPAANFFMVMLIQRAVQEYQFHSVVRSPVVLNETSKSEKANFPFVFACN